MTRTSGSEKRRGDEARERIMQWSPGQYLPIASKSISMVSSGSRAENLMKFVNALIRVCPNNRATSGFGGRDHIEGGPGTDFLVGNAVASVDRVGGACAVQKRGGRRAVPAAQPGTTARARLP